MAIKDMNTAEITELSNCIATQMQVYRRRLNTEKNSDIKKILEQQIAALAAIDAKMKDAK